MEGGGGGGGPGAATMGGRGRREDWAEGQPPLPWEGAGRGRRMGRRAGAAAMGGCGRRNGNGEEGGAPREGGLWVDAMGRRKKIPEREREGRMKKIGGEYITVGSYYNPAVMLTYHRRVVL